MPGTPFESNGSDVVISSRVRLARNLNDFPFPLKMTREHELKVLDRVRDSVLNIKKSQKNKFTFIDIGQLDALNRQVLLEKHLISPDMAQSSRERGVLISGDGTISIMINEEDHVRLQCIYPGMRIDDAWKKCSEIDSLLEEKVDFAFSRDYGYLTCCPTNAGTGIRASAMLHLPALTMTGYIKNLLEACRKLGVAVRGLYGENSEASGNMFQISNQVTLGQSEEEIVSSISRIVEQIVDQERTIRNDMLKQNPYRFEDKVYRSLGLVSNARIMSTEEALKLLSDVRLGVDMGIIMSVKKEILDNLLVAIQPANLQKNSGKTLNPEERDIKRAEIVRKSLTLE